MKSLRELARRAGVDSSYVSRTVNLTALAPDVVAAIFDETLSPDVMLFDVAVDPAGVVGRAEGAGQLGKPKLLARIGEISLSQARITVVCNQVLHILSISVTGPVLPGLSVFLRFSMPFLEGNKRHDAPRDCLEGPLRYV